MSFGRDSSLLATVSSFEDAVYKAFRTYTTVALESLVRETEELLDCKQPRMGAARTILGACLSPQF